MANFLKDAHLSDAVTSRKREEDSARGGRGIPKVIVIRLGDKIVSVS